MTPALAAPLLALGLFVQSAPPTASSGAAAPAGVGGATGGGATGGASVKRPDHDLADILLPLAGSTRRSGPVLPPSPPNGDDVQVDSASTKTQWLPSITVDPSDRRHLVATALDLRNDRRLKHDCNAAYYASFDGGKSWSEFLEHHTNPPQSADWTAVALGRDGTAYLLRTLLNGPGVSEIGVAVDGGVTEPGWTPTASDGADPCLAVDTTTGPYAGTLYIASNTGKWDGGPQWAIEVSISKDGGAHWEQHYVNGGGFSFRRLASTSLALDAKGGVYVAYFAADDQKIRINSSSDGGATWSGDVDVGDAARFGIPNLDSSLDPQPKLAIDASGGPFDGNLYVVWPRDGGSGGPDVVYSRSTDHGATWSSPVLASDVATNSQYAPAIAVDEEGAVLFGFCDCRDDPANTRIRYYVARSSDGGATILPNLSASDVDFDVSALDDKSAVAFRSAVAASDRRLHAIWSDARNGDFDVFTSDANLDLFTDVATISAATGGTASFTVDPGPLFQLTEYHVLGSLSGTTPGTDFYFENVPINYDLFTLATIYEANGPIFPGFTGTLDASGAATAQLVSGPLPPALIGVQMDFAALVRVAGAVRWGSAPTRVEIGN